MSVDKKEKIIFFLVGFLLGGLLSFGAGLTAYRLVKGESVLPKISLPSFGSGAVSSKDFIFDFESAADMKAFVPDDGVTLELSSAHAAKGAQALLVTIKAGGEFPGFAWEVYGRSMQDWSSKSHLVFQVYNNSEQYARLELKFKSGKKYPKKSFSFPVELDPLQMNTVRVPLATIGNHCDLKQMSGLKIFAKKPSASLILYFDDMKLE